LGRLIRVGHVTVLRSVNEEYHTDGVIGRLENVLLHFPFNKGISAWIDKHNRYSSMEAELVFRKGAGAWRFVDLFKTDPVVRRKTLKSIMFTLPCRSLFMFLGRYLIGRGFLDGRAGLKFCVLKTYYEFMIGCKISELRFRSHNLL
jgi:hypothetical protein